VDRNAEDAVFKIDRSHDRRSAVENSVRDELPDDDVELCGDVGRQAKVGGDVVAGRAGGGGDGLDLERKRRVHSI
jgi:hypothetical protein